MTDQPPDDRHAEDDAAPQWFVDAGPEPVHGSRFSSGATLLGLAGVTAFGLVLGLFRPSGGLVLALALVFLVGGLLVVVLGGTPSRRGLGLGVLIGWGLGAAVSGLLWAATGTATTAIDFGVAVWGQMPPPSFGGTLPPPSTPVLQPDPYVSGATP